MVDLESHEQNQKSNSHDDWFAISASRKATWYSSTFHNVTAMVGAGVLSLPYAMSQMGWGLGVTMIVMSWVITLFTLWQMVEMHEMVPGKRFDRYHELGQYAFGEKLGLYIVVPQQLLVDWSTCIVYMVTGGKSLQKFALTVSPGHKPLRLTLCIFIFAFANFCLSFLPSLDSISGVSLAASVMSLMYSTIAWTTTLAKGRLDNVAYTMSSASDASKVFNFMNALGDVAFSYAAHNVVLEIQATIPSTPEKPSTKPMWKGVVVAYIIVALCYFPVAFLGYYAFGNAVQDNILLMLERPRWLIAAANMFVLIHVIGGYQVFAMPVYDIFETLMVKKYKFQPSSFLRLSIRTSYIVITMFIGMTFPFFGGLVGFFGGFALAPTSYFLPCIIWLILKKPRRFSISWFTNWILIVLGVLLMVLAPIGGMRNIILSAKNYTFYQ